MYLQPALSGSRVFKPPALPEVYDLNPVYPGAYPGIETRLEKISLIKADILLHSNI